MKKLTEIWMKSKRLQRAQIVMGGVVVVLLAVLLILTAAGRNVSVSPAAVSDGAGAAEQTAVIQENTAAAPAVEAEAGTDAQPGPETAAGGVQSVSTVVSEPAVVSETEQVEDEEVTLLITLAGDATFGRDSNAEYSMSFDEAYDNHDVGWFLDNVRSYFAFDDLTIVNFEGTLTESEDRTEKTFAFKGPAEYVQILTEGSVEAVSLANNHAFDYGQQGYADTKATLEEAGVVSFGYDRSQVIEVKGIKVGLISLLEFYSSYEENESLLLQELEEVKSEGAQLIITTFHWGDEKSYDTYDTQVELAKLAIENGSDLVLGHHPHVVQRATTYMGKHIIYSVGNFCFGGNVYPYDMDACIYQQKFVFKNGELQEDDIYRVIPIRISSEYDYNNYQPTPQTGEIAERIFSKMQLTAETAVSDGWGN